MLTSNTRLKLTTLSQELIAKIARFIDQHLPTTEIVIADPRYIVGVDHTTVHFDHILESDVTRKKMRTTSFFVTLRNVRSLLFHEVTAQDLESAGYANENELFRTLRNRNPNITPFAPIMILTWERVEQAPQDAGISSIHDIGGESAR